MGEIKKVEDLTEGVETPKQEDEGQKQTEDYKKLYEELEKEFEDRNKLYEQAIKENQRLFSLCESYSKNIGSKKEESFIDKLIK